MGLYCPNDAVPKGHQKLVYNRTFHLYFLGVKFQLLGICCSRLYPEERTVFWFMTLLGSFWWVWGNNSSKQHQIGLTFWPRGVLIVLCKCHLNHFDDLKFFRDRTYSKFEFLVQLWPKFTSGRWPKSKIAIGLSRSVKIKALFCNKMDLDCNCLIFYDSFLRYLNFGVFVKSTNFKVSDVIISIVT